MEGILDLINSAVLDQDVMGGLRWPLEKASSGDRFRLDRVWHTVAKSYVSPVVRLKLRNVDRYDFGTSVGEASKEVILKLKQVTSELLVSILITYFGLGWVGRKKIIDSLVGLVHGGEVYNPNKWLRIESA